MVYFVSRYYKLDNKTMPSKFSNTERNCGKTNEDNYKNMLLE